MKISELINPARCTECGQQAIWEINEPDNNALYFCERCLSEADLHGADLREADKYIWPDGCSDNEMKNIPCACDACREKFRSGVINTPIPGHFLCEGVPDIFLKAEDEGRIYAAFANNKWRWYSNADTKTETS